MSPESIYKPFVCSMFHRVNGKEHLLNLIDTPVGIFALSTDTFLIAESRAMSILLGKYRDHLLHVRVLCYSYVFRHSHDFHVLIMLKCSRLTQVRECKRSLFLYFITLNKGVSKLFPS